MAETLESIVKLDIPAGYVLSVIVSDNDTVASLGDMLTNFANRHQLELKYVHAPDRNISIARNACLDEAQCNLLAFIDDDEIAQPDWLSKLIETQKTTGASVVFGPSRAVYPATAHAWMVLNDFHSNIPSANQGMIETGYCSNVLLNMIDPRVAKHRFDLSFGRTGGEDTDFFFRLQRQDVPMAIAMDALVHEPVAPSRMSFGWVLKRRYATGRIYGYCAVASGIDPNWTTRLGLMSKSFLKSIFCAGRSVASILDRTHCTFWLMRSSFHTGVMSGALARPRHEPYGGDV